MQNNHIEKWKIYKNQLFTVRNTNAKEWEEIT